MMNLLKKNLSCSSKLLNVGWCTELSQHIAPIWEKAFYFLETLKAYTVNLILSLVYVVEPKAGALESKRSKFAILKHEVFQYKLR